MPTQLASGVIPPGRPIGEVVAELSAAGEDR